MALTPAEEEELRLLEQRKEALQLEREGRQTLERVAEPTRRKPEPEPRDFSLLRVLGGGARDAIQGVFDVTEDINAALGGGYIRFGDKADNGIIDYISQDEADQAGVRNTKLANFEGSENAGMVERGLRGLTSFAIPFAGAFKAARGLQALGRAGNFARGMAAGAAADFAQVDPYEGNIVNVMDQFGIAPDFLQDLISEDDDSRMLARFKAAAGGTVVGIGADALIASGAKALRSYKVWKGTREEAEAVVQEFRKGNVALEPVKRESASTSSQAADSGDIPTVEADEVRFPGPDDEATMGSWRVPESDDPEDVLTFLKDRAGDIEMDEETFSRFAKNLMDGDPENALVKLGIDPLKIDFSKLDNADMLARFHKGLMEVYEGIATKLGRSNQRVTASELLRASRSMATTPDVLKDLYGSTSKLAETLMASRMFVGAHAHKLVATAEAALKEMEELGEAGPAWAEFIESFHRQAYFMGALRGAGSEVGRALRSLQFLLKDSPRTAKRVVGEAVEQSDKAREGLSGRSLPSGASAFADSLGTNAEKIEALNRLIGLRGDVEELSRTVREGAAYKGKRMSQVVKETVGSLFSPFTASYNILSGGVYLAANGLGRWTAALLRSPALMTNGKASLEAQRALYEAWGYTAGVLGGFREATANTLKVLEREFLSEASLNANALGMDKQAAKWAKASADANKDITGHFERADVVTSKAFAITATERKLLEEKVREFGGPKFFQAGLKGLLRMTAATVNAGGTAFRTGTTAFINLPDEFVGTLAKRAGAYSEAVRLATREAGEMGLSGKEASEYLKARTITLFGDGPKGWSEDAFADGGQHTIARAGDAEAKMVLFQDQLEGALNRKIANAFDKADTDIFGIGSLIIPFIRTPLRILERTARDFTPWGFARQRVRNAILHGTPAERDEALARMSLGMIALFTAYQLAEDRQIIGHDGGYNSAARDAGRKSYTLKIGDDLYEFNRIDPLGTLLGIGADMREFIDAAGDDPQAGSLAMEATEAFFWSLTTNILSKTWLTSISQITELVGAKTDDEFSNAKEQFLKNQAARLIPAAGTQRAIMAWQEAGLRESATLMDSAKRTVIGAADTLPMKRNFLGRVIERQPLERAVGLAFSIAPNEDTDPVMAEMANLSPRKLSSRRTQKGVRLNAVQYSRFLELRGQIVKDPKTGLTMEETLHKVVTHPRYQSLPKAAKKQVLSEAVDGFTKLANEALTKEDESFALAQLKNEVFERSALTGMSRPERDELFELTSELYRMKN